MTPGVDLDALTRQLAARGAALTRQEMARDALAARVTLLTTETASLTAQAELLTQAGVLLSSIADERQQAVQRQVELIVTRGYEAVFGAGLSFHLMQSTRGAATTIDFIIRTTFADGTTLDTPVLDARGGGLAAVTGFLLRVVVLLLTPGHRRLLVLDEFAAHLSAEYVPALAEFMAELSRVAGVQIVMVTHQDEFLEAADKAYRFTLDADGKTKVAAL